MRLLLFLAFLTAFAVAQEQVPLADRIQGWLSRAKSYVPTAAPVASPQELREPQALREKNVTRVDLNNYRSVLAQSSQPQDWFLYITGGNKTCFGRCDRADKAFNESVKLFAVDEYSPNLAILNCEDSHVLCSAWSAATLTVWYIQIPQAQDEGQHQETPLYVVPVNGTTVTPEDLFKIYADKTYLEVPKDESVLHPFDSWAAKTGANLALGYVLYGFSAVPSWLLMITISFASRALVGRRMGSTGRGTAPAPRPT